MRDDGREKLPEITSLNDADLSVDELEQRLELMAAMPAVRCGTMTCNGMTSCGSLESCSHFTVGPARPT